MPFHFRLESLLQLHKAQRHERRAELAQALRAQDDLRERRETLAGEIKELHGQRAVSGGPLNIEQLIEEARYESLLSSRQRQLEQRSLQIASDVDHRHEALLAADQQVRLLEKLKSTQRDRHESEQHRNEQRQIDEVASLPRLLER